jgi:hypothetical protein
VGKSGGKPKPRKDSALSVMIAVAIPSVAETMIGDSTFGRIWRRIMSKSEVPIDRAASTNSRSFRARTSPRTMRAVCIHEVMPTSVTIRMKVPPSGPNACRQTVAEQQHRDQQKRQKRQREEEVGQPHQRTVEPAGKAREHAHQRADQDRQDHRRDTHRDRHPAARQEPRQRVAAKVVGAQRMRPVDLGAGIEQRGIDRPDVAQLEKRAASRDLGRIVPVEERSEISPADDGEMKTTIPAIAPRWRRNWSQTSHHWLRGGLPMCDASRMPCAGSITKATPGAHRRAGLSMRRVSHSGSSGRGCRRGCRRSG